MFPVLMYIFLLSSPLLLIAGAGTLTEPTVKPYNHSIHVNPLGKDIGNTLADSLNPLRSFDSVFSVLRKKQTAYPGINIV